jgi:hypothetical protein
MLGVQIGVRADKHAANLLPKILLAQFSRIRHSLPYLLSESVTRMGPTPLTSLLFSRLLPKPPY